MKIVQKTTMLNGTEIQLEDWSDKNTEKYPNLYGFTIGSYPTAKNTGKYRWIEGGKKFGLQWGDKEFVMVFPPSEDFSETMYSCSVMLNYKEEF